MAILKKPTINVKVICSSSKEEVLEKAIDFAVKKQKECKKDCTLNFEISAKQSEWI